MAVEDTLRSVGLDRYDLNARLKPALLTLLPAILGVAFWIPQARTFTGATITLLSSCGLLYLMSQTTRRLGRSVERLMGDKAGRKHSARLLTHLDETIQAETKARYHAYLRNHGLAISTPDEERSSPDTAFSRTSSAVDWLLEHTRPNAKTSLLFNENIAYGYQRNLYGLKFIALTIALTVSVGHGILLWTRPMDDTSLWIGLGLEAALIAMILLWLTTVTKASVTDASLAYAQQLFGHCEKTPSVTIKPRRDEAGPVDVA